MASPTRTPIIESVGRPPARRVSDEFITRLENRGVSASTMRITRDLAKRINARADHEDAVAARASAKGARR